MQGSSKSSSADLDPRDWHAFRVLAHEMLDASLSHLESIRSREVWKPVPEEVRLALRREIPTTGIGARHAFEEFQRVVLPYGYGNTHPRFWGWVNGNGTPFTVLADLLAATMNPNVYGSDSSPYYVERQVIEWLKELLGFPLAASGLLLTGGSMANLVGLTAALHDQAPDNLRSKGLGGIPARMVIYGSDETHHSVDKAVALLGLGTESLRRIPVRDDFTIDLARLEDSIACDRTAGLEPFCVVANAGTVSTGAIDPLDEIADLCSREGLWLHVDGAFGALAAASSRLRHLVRGLERVDSLAFDLHKWLHMPIDVGCVLVRDPAAHRRPFAASAPYLETGSGGVLGDVEPFGDLGLELTRPFRALKVWMGFLEQGADAYVASIENNVRQACYLADLVSSNPCLELLAPVALNVVNFRYLPPDKDDAGIDELNRRLLVAVQESGVAVPSQANIRGRSGLRVALTNHRTVDEDLEGLVDVAVRLGDELSSGRRGG